MRRSTLARGAAHAVSVSRLFRAALQLGSDPDKYLAANLQMNSACETKSVGYGTGTATTCISKIATTTMCIPQPGTGTTVCEAVAVELELVSYIAALHVMLVGTRCLLAVKHVNAR